MSLFCYQSIAPYKAQRINLEHKFANFMAWAKATDSSMSSPSELKGELTDADHVVQLVRQVNFGPLESKRYFARPGVTFAEVSERDLIDANFKKLNSFKDFRCGPHNRFFEVNVYQKDPRQTHHWRADVDRPAVDIDL